MACMRGRLTFEPLFACLSVDRRDAAEPLIGKAVQMDDMPDRVFRAVYRQGPSLLAVDENADVCAFQIKRPFKMAAGRFVRSIGASINAPMTSAFTSDTASSEKASPGAAKSVELKAFRDRKGASLAIDVAANTGTVKLDLSPGVETIGEIHVAFGHDARKG